MSEIELKPAKPTLKDVAKLAGCSAAVVSAVVNNARGNVLASEAMRKRVREAAKKLGYRSNFASRSLVRGATDTIGIYVPPDPGAGLGLPYEAAIVQGIEQACRDHGYDVLAINLSGSGSPDICFHKFAEQRIDGLILLHVDESRCDWIVPLLKQSPNIVAVNYYGRPPVDRVNFDDETAGEIAVRHLIEQGHRRIAYLGGVHAPRGPGSDMRCAGYQKAMKRGGLPVDPRWVWNRSRDNPHPADDTPAKSDDGGAAATHLWQLGGDRPTAILAYSDGMAVAAIRQLKKMGCRIPQDVSVVGIDDSEVCEVVSPSLTSVRQPFPAMGRRATELLIRKAKAGAQGAKGQSAPHVHELFAPELVMRESTSAPCEN